MGHRAESILAAARTLIAARVEPGGTKTYIHRRMSLDPEQDELPAVTVDYGEDSRVDSQFMRSLDSVLSMQTTAVVAMPTEPEVRSELLRLRREIHRALMADQRLGLPNFVVTTQYGGASAPVIDVTGELLVGELQSLWLVHYRTDLADPGSD